MCFTCVCFTLERKKKSRQMFWACRFRLSTLGATVVSFSQRIIMDTWFSVFILLYGLTNTVCIFLRILTVWYRFVFRGGHDDKTRRTNFKATKKISEPHWLHILRCNNQGIVPAWNSNLPVECMMMHGSIHIDNLLNVVDHKNVDFRKYFPRFDLFLCKQHVTWSLFTNG